MSSMRPFFVIVFRLGWWLCWRWRREESVPVHLMWWEESVQERVGVFCGGVSVVGGGVSVHLVTIFTFRYRTSVVMSGSQVFVEYECYGCGEDDDDGDQHPNDQGHVGAWYGYLILLYVWSIFAFNRIYNALILKMTVTIIIPTLPRNIVTLIMNLPSKILLAATHLHPETDSPRMVTNRHNPHPACPHPCPQ